MKSRLNNKGFSYVELLAVMAILIILMSVGILVISRTIVRSRKKAYLMDIYNQKRTVEAAINSDKIYVFDTETVYYFDYRKYAEGEQLGESPFGDWVDCYVVVTFDGKTNHFFWTGLDDEGWKVDLRKEVKNLTVDDIYKSKSKRIVPGNTLGARDNIVIHSSEEEDPIERTPSNDVSLEEAEQCFNVSKLENGTYSIVDYNAECGPLVDVPSSIDGQMVTRIEENSFLGKGITDVTLYYGITFIGDAAFKDNQIKNLKLSSTIETISQYAFYNNKLTSLDLPDGIKTIGDYAFAANQIQFIIFPTTLTKIGALAFKNNKLTEIELKSTPTVGSGAFSYNLMDDSSAFIYRYDATTGTTDYSTIVAYGGSSKDIVIPDVAGPLNTPVTKIGSGAFSEGGIKSVVFSKNLIEIGSSAFYACSLTSINLPDGLKKIGAEAFRQNRLKSITIPDSVTSIGKAAFIHNCVPTGSDMIYNRIADPANPGKGKWDYTTITGSSGGGYYKGVSGCNSKTIPLNIPESHYDPVQKKTVYLKIVSAGAFNMAKYTEINLPNLDLIPEAERTLTIGDNAFYRNQVGEPTNGEVDKRFIPEVKDGEIHYNVISSFAGGRGLGVSSDGENLKIPRQIKSGTDVTTINASFGWTYYTTYEIPSTVTTFKSAALFTKGYSNNRQMKKIYNKTGRAFNWYYQTGSAHTPADGNKSFITGVVSHGAGDVEIAG